MSRTCGYLLIAGAILFGSFWLSDAACTPLGSSTLNFSLCKPAVGEVGWGAVVNANMDTIDSNLTNSLPRSYLAGFGLANTAAATPTKVDIAAGQAQDAGNAGAMTLAATLTKDLTAPWAVGSGNGCLGNTVTRTASTWYHIFVIKRTDTNVVDAYCDTSVSAANIPAPYTLFRRVGSLKTDAGTNNLQFVQDGDYFRWTLSIKDIADTNPGTAATTTKVSTPLGVATQGIFNASLISTVTNSALYVSDLGASDEAPSITNAPLFSLGQSANNGATFAGMIVVRTNTNSQIRYRLTGSDGNTTVRIVTLGWWDRRGRDN